mgnify:CR=1 FL=1
MKAQLETWQHEVETALPALDEAKSIDQLRVKYLGKRGLITLAVREIGKLPPAERPLMGKVANDVKAMIEQLIDARLAEGATEQAFLDDLQPHAVDPRQGLRELRSPALPAGRHRLPDLWAGAAVVLDVHAAILTAWDLPAALVPPPPRACRSRRSCDIGRKRLRQAEARKHLPCRGAHPGQRARPRRTRRSR